MSTHPDRQHRGIQQGVAGLMIATLAACTGSQQSSETGAEAVATTQPAATAPTAQPREEITESGSDSRDSRTRWLGDIPYDVFYDQPLQVAAENATVATLTPVTGTSATTDPTSPGVTPQVADTPPAEGPAASMTSPIDWAQIAPIELLEEETKQVRNRLTTNLQTVATYNSNVEAIANDGETLAVLAAVIGQHPGQLGWKDKAPYVRDLGHEIFLKAEGSGRTSYTATQAPFESIVTILNGGPPPERAVEENVSFADIADRGEMMKRFKKSFDFLKSEINTPDRLKEQADAATREATVLAALGSLLRDHSYDSADEPDYKQFALDFVEGNRGMVQAVSNADFPAFEAARSRVQNACNACHGAYAFGDEGL